MCGAGAGAVITFFVSLPFFPGLCFNSKNRANSRSLCCGSFEPPACAVHDSRCKIPCSAAAALSARPAAAIQRPSWSDKAGKVVPTKVSA